VKGLARYGRAFMRRRRSAYTRITLIPQCSRSSGDEVPTLPRQPLGAIRPTAPQGPDGPMGSGGAARQALRDAMASITLATSSHRSVTASSNS
jgi:hypothetical protein